MNRHSALALLIGALLPACRTEAHDSAFTSRDSAGIRILESQSPLWTAGAGVWLDTASVVRIGAQGGEEAYQLFRVYSALRLDNGSIVVANSGTHELRFYDGQGAFLRATGRSGEGPGEFSEYSSMRMHRTPSGEIAVEDNDVRFHLFDVTGDFRRTVRLDPGPSGTRAFLTGPLSDGSWVALLPGGAFRGQPGEVVTGQFRYARYSVEGEQGRVLLTTHDRPRYVHQAYGVVHYPYIPFAAEQLVATRGATLLALDGAKSEIRILDTLGLLRDLIRWTRPAPTRTASVYHRYVEADLQGSDPQQRRLDEDFYNTSGLPIPEYVPAYQTILVDREGTVWLERFRLPWEESPVWDLVDQHGRWLGPVRTPDGLRIYDVGDDYLLGLERDSLGVEQVVLFHLKREASGAG